ncbi:WhiB family transcriptional regulator [Nonomuraea sp. NPDC050547]|uniref:WhiB family transcriptional regulator n=1 Tax=Nonomuraea sp. NPDC050547 TaxID=3364368 RepID=UPI0037B4A071
MTVLLDYLYLPTWDGTGACIGQPDLMYGLSEGGDDAAKKLCRACPVLDECRDWVLDLPWHCDPGGIVAGLTIQQRGRLSSSSATFRECITCSEIKPLYAFAPWASGREQRRPTCRACDYHKRRSAEADRATTITSEGTQ